MTREEAPAIDCVERERLLKIYEDRFFELQKLKHLEENKGAEDRQLGVNYCINILREMPTVTPQQKIGRCKDCKYFEYDREICSRWGNGCKTKEDGYCFLFKPQPLQGRKRGRGMSKIEELLKLIKENPDLPIIPMVGSEVVAEDSSSYWIGSWGRCELTEYYIGRECVHFKDDDAEDILTDMVGCEYGETKDGKDLWDLSDKEWEELVASLPWVKAIVVYIESPDEV